MSQAPPPPPPLPPEQPYTPNYHTPPKDDAISTLIPYRNTPALVSYYLGVFSLIPCIGLPLAIVALILGIRGLKVAAERPEAKGKAHAIVGIVLGSIVGMAYVVFGVIALVGILSSRH